MNGVVVVDKPAGMTSHDVVDRVRALFGIRRVGHGGTLDPDATGVLVVGLGRATRLLSYAQAAPKTYLAEARLGVTTTTQDASGEVVEHRPVDVDRAGIEGALAGLTGDIDQVPPMVSAVRVGGERLYRKARRGEEVARRPRRVTVYELELLQWSGHDLRLRVRCSGGTYVRTLVADLGEALGCGAHLTALRRTEASGFTEAEAIPLNELRREHLRPPLELVRLLPRVEVGPQEARALGHGRAVAAAGPADGAAVAVTCGGELVAVARRRDGALHPETVVAP